VPTYKYLAEESQRGHLVWEFRGWGHVHHLEQLYLRVGDIKRIAGIFFNYSSSILQRGIKKSAVFSECSLKYTSGE
jgi:hypothetical protein